MNSRSSSASGRGGDYYPLSSSSGTSYSGGSNPSTNSGPSKLDEQFQDRKSQEEADRQASQARKDADFQSRRRQDEANYAKQQAVKQAEYNANTRHMKDRIDQANAKQREADEAERRARKLR